MAAKTGTKKKKPVNVIESYNTVEMLSLTPEEITARGDALVKVIKKVNKANTTEAVASIKEIDKQSSKSESKGPSLKGPQTSMGLLQSLAKSTTSEKFAGTQSTGVRTAASILQGVAGSSSLVKSGLSMLAGGINLSSVAFSVLSTAVEKTTEAFVEAFTKLNEITNNTVTTSNFTARDISEFRKNFSKERARLNEELGGAYIDNKNIDAALQELTVLFKNDKDAISKFTDEALLLNELGINMTGSLQKMMRNQFYLSNKGEQTTEGYLNNLVYLSKMSVLSLEELVSLQEKTRVDANLIYSRVLSETGDAETAAKAQENYQNMVIALESVSEKLGLPAGAVDTVETIIAGLATATPQQMGEYQTKYGATGIFGMDAFAAREMVYNGQSLELSKNIMGNVAKLYGTDSFMAMAQELGVLSEVESIKGSIGEDWSKIAKELDEAAKAQQAAADALKDTVGKQNITFGEQLQSIPDSIANWLLSWLDPATWANFARVAGWVASGPIRTTARVLKGQDIVTGVPMGGVGGPDDSGSAAWSSASDAVGSSPWRLTAGFKSPAYRAKFGRDHTGVDYGAAAGTLLPSTVAGTVSDVGYNATSGNYVKVTDGNGQTHLFAHMQSVDVRKGDSVGAGTVLGRVGSTGRSTGPHVHYGVAKSGQWINPRPWATSVFSKGIASGSFATNNTIPATESILSSSVAVDNSGLYAMKYGIGGPDISAPSAISSKVTSSNAYSNEDTVAALKNMNLSINDNLSVIIRLVADVVNTMNTNKSTDIKTISYIQR